MTDQDLRDRTWQKIKDDYFLDDRYRPEMEKTVMFAQTKFAIAWQDFKDALRDDLGRIFR